MTTDVLVIGAGAAGCATALALRKRGMECALVEKTAGRPHRFCGEFLSGEARDSLESLNAVERFERRSPMPIRRMGLHGASGRRFEMTLSNGGYGISRQALDGMLADLAEERGARLLRGRGVAGIVRAGSGYRVSLQGDPQPIDARIVVGAHGKRANVDRLLGRGFIERDSRYVGVKCHWRGVKLGREIKLFLFPGGHCGLVEIEGERAALAMLATRGALLRAGGRPERLIEHARRSNPALEQALRHAEREPGSLLTIGRIPLRLKEQVAGGVFLVGDAGGITAPFLGLGVTNALRSGIACGELLADHLGRKISRPETETAYRRWWSRHMRKTQLASFAASALLCHSSLGEWGLGLVSLFPSLGRVIYQRSRATSEAPG